MHGIAVSYLGSFVWKAHFAVFALIRQRVVFRRMFIQMLFQLEIGFEALPAEFASKQKLLILSEGNDAHIRKNCEETIST